MNVTGDDLAGVVDLFGALTPDELRAALDELAYRQGAEPPDESAIAEAVDAYTLVAYTDGETELFVSGPTAFPALPEGAMDLPHILDIEERAVSMADVGESVEARFRGDVARAVAVEDDARVRELLDVSYELEAWAPVELAELRTRIDTALEAA
jgi:hypothetical protein